MPNLNQAVIFYGGDVNIGRRANFNRYEKPFSNLKIMTKADLRIINLECVIAVQGHQGINKGEGGPYYYHARPEQINLLIDAQIDVALTANNHCKDYYDVALIEQGKYLDLAGILHCGTGANINDAARPLFVKVKDIIVAIFNVDSTLKYYAATPDKAGTFYLPPEKPELWQKYFAERFAAARRYADIILAAPHWGLNGVKEPSEQTKTLGRLLIDCGADAVLGCHSHYIQGVETYKDRPIIYDAGNFVFDSLLKPYMGGAFSLTITKRGVEEVSFTPLLIDFCRAVPVAEAQELEMGGKFISACRKLNTPSAILEPGLVKLKFNPPPRAERELEQIKLSVPRHDGIKFLPLSEPLPEWTAAQVPADAAIEPQQFGALKLIGCRVPPECINMKRRQMLYVETWWTIDEPTDKDLRIYPLGVPVIEKSMPNIGAGMFHQGCDWMWPTNRWKPGVIYYERFGLRPPGIREMVNVGITLQVLVLDGKEILGKYIYPKSIQLQIPNRPTASVAAR